jgi:hypothetical protein
MVRYHWERQIRQANRRGLIHRKVHGLASLSFIDLFENRLEEGLARAKEALEAAEKLRLDNQVVRLCLNLSIYSILSGNAQEGRAYLLKGEQLAIRHGIGRRLWRITANLATVDELLGVSERAYSRDLQVLKQLKASFTELRLDGKEMLALVNVVLRARSEKDFLLLTEEVPGRCLDAAQIYSEWVLTDQRGNLPGLLGNYCARLSVGPRFLLSE